MCISRTRVAFLLLLLHLLPLTQLSARTGGNLYRIECRPDGKPKRLVFVEALGGKSPEDRIRDAFYPIDLYETEQNGLTIFNSKPQGLRVPILCFHRIGDDTNYEISLDKGHELFSSLVEENFFPISDYDFGRGDFSSVPRGMKPIVLGADDAAQTQYVWQDEDGTLDPDCLASLFMDYFEPSKGHYNFTFYVSFDALPFRQTFGGKNTGAPYRNISVVGEKFRDINNNFHLAHHSLTHTFRGKQSVEALIKEIQTCNTIFSDYLGSKVKLPTFAFPYGVGNIGPGDRGKIESAILEGEFPAIAYDLDDELARLPWDPQFQSWRISRLSVDNGNYEYIHNKLQNQMLYESERVILIYANSKKVDINQYNINYGQDDKIYVFIP